MLRQISITSPRGVTVCFLVILISITSLKEITNPQYLAVMIDPFSITPRQKMSSPIPCLHYTLAARGLEEHCVSFPDICDNRQFHVIISKNFWFTIHVDSWFWRKFDRICWACAIFCWIPNLQACTDRQTDRQTDGRTDVYMDGLTDRRTDGRTHRWINLGGGWVTYGSSRLTA